MRDARWLVFLVAALLWGCTGSGTPSPTAPDDVTTSTAPATGGSTSSSMGSSSTSTSPPDRVTETLRIGTLIPVTSLDPADAFVPGDWEVIQAFSDGLLRHEPGNGAVVPALATELPTVSEDGLTYTFELRDDVEFADGTPLTAQLYVDSIERVMELGGQGSDLVSLYVSGIEAPDETTVVFHLRDSFAFFPTLLAGAAYVPVHPEVFLAEELSPMPESPIYGVGPWYVRTYTETEITLETNPNYFGETVEPGRIVIRLYETSEDMATALINEDVDIIWREVDSATADSLSEAPGLFVEPVPSGTIHFLVVNHTLEPTDDPLVRRALAELVERQTISDSVLGGAFAPAFSPVPPGYAGSSEAFKNIYGEADVAAAIDLLTEAGFSSDNRADLELAYPPEQFGLEMASAMEELELQIESTGLVEVTLTAQPWSTYVGDVVDGTYNLAFLGWLHDFPDTHNYMAPFVLNGGLGGSGENLEHPELVDMVAQAAIEFDATTRADLYEQAQTLFAEDVVTLPLWLEHPYVAYRDHVGGSDAYQNQQALNIGTSLQLDYRSIQLDLPDEG